MTRPLTIIATGDNHFHAGPRFAECVRVHEWIAEEVRRRKPDVFLMSGDLYETDSTPDERSAAAAFHTAVAEVCPVIEVQGNHGRRRDLRILSRLHARHPVIIEEAARVHYVAGAAIAAMAWPERSSVAAMIGQPLAADTTDAIAQDLMRGVLRGLGAELGQHEGPRILLGHFMVDGSVTTSAQPILGAELNIGLGDLALAGAHMVVMGHVHQAQHWDHGGVPMAYCGSALRHTYGEPEAKSILYAEVAGDGAVTWERIPTPARPMHLLTGRYTAGKLEVPLPPTWEQRDADIRIRYYVAEAEAAAAAIAVRELRAALLAAGAADVQPEPVRELVTTVRAPEVVAAATVEAQLAARWGKRLESAATQARMLTLLDEIQGEAA